MRSFLRNAEGERTIGKKQRRWLIAAAVLVLGLTAAFLWPGFLMPWGGSAPVRVAPSPSPSAQEPQELTVAEIYQTLLPSVVSIRATGASAATGTGVIANADGTILTAFHVVEGAQSIEVTFADGTTSAATIQGADPSIDIAILTPETLPGVVVPAVIGGGGGVGDDVVAIGNPLGLNYSTTSGVISGLDRSMGRDDGEDLEGLIQFDAAVNPGSSGGPLVNVRGETVGIVVALVNPTQAGTFIGIGFAVPMGTALGAGEGPLPQL
jgi:putative serine protease PepD